jgi:hypothetical protein
LPHSPSLLGSQGFHSISFFKKLRVTARNPLKTRRIPFHLLTMRFPDEPVSNTEFLTTDRRRVLGTLGLTGLGWIATSTSSEASIFQKRTQPKVTVPTNAHRAPAAAGRIDLTDLNPNWAQSQGRVLPEYTRYLTSLKLQRISPGQVIEAHAKSKGGVWNSLPPKAWWVRMGYTLRVADRVALEMGAREVEVVSAYRSPAYNARCAGARAGSWHQANVAVDVKFPMRASVVTAAARSLRDRGLFKGGIGGYGNFTHIDTRGQNINW